VQAKVFLEQHPHVFDALQAAVREELQHTEVRDGHHTSEPLAWGRGLDLTRTRRHWTPRNWLRRNVVTYGVTWRTAQHAFGALLQVHHDLSDPLLPAVEAEGQEGAAAAAEEPTGPLAAAGAEVGALEGAEAPVVAGEEAVVEPPSGVGELDIGVDYMTGEVQNMGAYVMAKERAAEAREQA
jgi:hypothetical protein